MTPWQKSFQDHQLVSKTGRVIDTLENAPVDTADAVTLNLYSRLLKALKFIRGRLKSIDPELISHSSINNLGSWLTNTANHVQNFISTKNTGHLQTANSAVDSMLDVVRSFRVTPKADEQAIGASTTAFRDKAIEEIERVRDSRKEAISDLAAVKRDLTQTKAGLEKTNEVIEKQKARLDQSIAEFQKQFSQAEAKRGTDFQTALAKVTADAAATITEAERELENEREKQIREFDALREQASKLSDEHLAMLQDREKKADEIFGAIGSSAFAGQFRQAADEQRTAANRYRFIALALMCGMVGMACLAFYHTLRQTTVDWHLFTFRLATSLVIVVPALYAARESAKHRDRERQLRRSHLELASIDAYLALLPEEKRNQLKAELTSKFFGQDEPLGKDDDSVSGHKILDMLEMVLKNLTRGS